MPKIAILGVGNPLCSDDAAGVLVARGLRMRFGRDLDSVLVIEAGPTPENRTAELRHFAPDILILIDAAEMGLAPGEIHWVQIEEIDGLSASTHTLPLSLLAKYMTLEMGSEAKVLGIQPKSTEIGGPVSAEVLQAVDTVVYGLVSSLSAGQPLN